MKLMFVPRPDSPERLVCDAEIHFGDDTPLAGMRLVGFSLWRGADDEVRVTFPARGFGSGEARRFFDFLRYVGDMGRAKAVKAWIIQAWKDAGEPGSGPVV